MKSVYLINQYIFYFIRTRRFFTYIQFVRVTYERIGVLWGKLISEEKHVLDFFMNKSVSPN